MVIVEIGIKLGQGFKYYDNLLKSHGLTNDFKVITHDIYYTNKSLDGLSESEMKNACIRLRSHNHTNYKVQNNLINGLDVEEVSNHEFNDFENRLATFGYKKIFDTTKKDYHYYKDGMSSKIQLQQIEGVGTLVYYDNKDYYRKRKLGDVVLKLVNYSGPGFHDVNLEVRKGEIIGFTGLQGAGSSELMQAMFGVVKSNGGDAIAFDKQLTNKSIKKVMKDKVGMVPSNRKENSVFDSLTILDNTSVASNSINSKIGFSPKKERTLYESYKKQLNIKAKSSNDLLVSLSGGNQQKVIIGRWLKTNADILLLDNPTQGIDVGAKAEIYKLLLELAEQGKTIIFNTLEVPEIMKCADRCCVFYHGTIEKILNHDEVTEEKVMYYATSANKTEVENND